MGKGEPFQKSLFPLAIAYSYSYKPGQLSTKAGNNLVLFFIIPEISAKKSPGWIPDKESRK
jgi:hypothetical protein